ncbi:MAG: phytanoyl-CoA dioxygenase family protein [Planctomycetota bacterium]|jgi:ectoine hydroxylase-related dioxygenase (phytanoyl-CoA dioxygenase family)|nr:phytanoyl-CoA dioxygenase family protein [Planctomycetota bacterium]MDP7130176.1 phytanoyl-CoA dioxygenase family protein [Planctomycetota bacterium]MDP7252932.1 phytanoyl-CoA dioxygenase family protein [Planctomycetota bacterium]
MSNTQNEQPQTSLTQDQIDHFRQHGYVRIGKVLTDEEIDLYRREYDHEFEQARQSGRFRNLTIDDTQDVKEKNEAPEQMLQIMQMCERNIHFRRLIYHEKILDMMEALLGPNIQLFHDQALYKPANHGGPVFWHQDNGYWRCSPANLVTCWLTLDDVEVNNGAMQMIPGSHLRPLEHVRSESTSALFDIESQADTPNAVVVDLPAGGALFHHCQTLHYSAPNATDRQRRAFAIHFMPPGTKSMHTGDFLKVGFDRPMLRTRA